MKRRLLQTLITCIVMSSLIVVPVAAAPQDKVSALEEQKNQAEAAASSVNEELVALLVDYDALKGDIKNQDKRVKKAEKDLKKAEADEKKQYEDMKLRIKYMYEQGETSFFETMVSAKSYSELVNKAEYVQKVHDYDRDMLDKYVETKNEVKELKTNLESDQAEMEFLAEEMGRQKETLEGTLTEMRSQISDFDTQLAVAKEEAAAQLEAMARETAAAEAEAAQEAETDGSEEGTENDDQGSESQNAPQTDSDETEDSKEESKPDKEDSKPESKPDKEDSKPESKPDIEDSKPESKPDKEDNKPESKPDKEESKPDKEEKPSRPDKEENKPDKEEKPSKPDNASKGQQIANKGLQYVGNPYKYSGNSLTNGIDCSGFVQQIHRKFGISTPRTSSAIRSGGKSVSYADKLPGDVICYSGHVGIYIGNNTIVHASNSAPYPKGGIKTTSPANYRSVLAVRRYW